MPLWASQTIPQLSRTGWADVPRVGMQVPGFRGTGMKGADEMTEGDPGICRGCGERIVWVVTAAGKHAPMNEDGSSHFSTCSRASDFRRGGKR